jgi:signal transduction histidine kinase
MGADEVASLDGRTSRLRRLACLCVAAGVVLVVSIGQTAAQSKKIMVVHSYGQNFEPGATWSKAIRKALNQQSPWLLDIQEFSLVTARSGDEATEARFIDYLKAIYAQRPPDLIIALNAPAARFIQQRRADLYPATPSVLALVEVRRVEQSLLTEQDVVVGVRFDQVALVKNILRLLPETKAIAIIIGNSPLERFWADEQRRILTPVLENKIELILYNERPFEEILKKVASLPPHSAIFFQQLSVDGAGTVHGDLEPLKRIHEAANAPIFSWIETYANGEIVGGPMFSPAEGGQATAAVAVRLLGGEKAGDITVPPIEFSAPKYDWRQLQRWNISESRLPPGSEILFREPTVWERFRWQMIAICAVLLLQGFTIAGLLYEDRRRRLAEGEAKERMSELAHVNRFSTVGELTTSIAHEMNQPLGSILANVETLQCMLKSPAPDMDEIREIAADIRRDDVRAGEVIQRLRSLLKKAPFELKPVDLNEIVRGSVALLSSQVAARQVDVSTEVGPPSLPISGDQVQLQQVILNLLVNAMDAMSDIAAFDRRLAIWTSLRDEFAEVAIADAGPGIPPDRLSDVFQPFFTTKAHGMGMGLSIARTIIEAHNGTISAHNQAKGGAVFQIRLPLRKS